MSAEKPVSSIPRLLFKALFLVFVISVVFALVFPMRLLGDISLYNTIFQGRYRLPYSEDPTREYSISTNNLEALFASHEINGIKKPDDEFRIVVIGDSSSWGFLLPPTETLAASINDLNMQLDNGKHIRAYNLAYPVMSLTKDLLFLRRAFEYEPDLIVWPVTLESFPQDKQLFHPLLQNNPDAVRQLITEYDLNLDKNDPRLGDKDFLEKTIIGSRRDLADLIRLQLFGVLWSATGIDHFIPDEYTPRMEDLPGDLNYHTFSPPNLDHKMLALDVLQAGVENPESIPVLLVNEPIFISQGENSDIRYNFMYPKWAYDEYRRILNKKASSQDWLYFDLWDAIPPEEFTNTAVHLSAAGTKMLASKIGDVILEMQDEIVNRPY
jgi:hypothetical protein